MEFMHLCDFLTRLADLSTMSNFHFLLKALFLKPSHFFSLHFFLLQVEGLMPYTGAGILLILGYSRWKKLSWTK